MARSYLVRHGLMPRLGRFLSDSADFGRGDTVVVRSRRGTELGEILVSEPTPSQASLPESAPRILRTAGADDLERAHRVMADRDARYLACQQLFREGVWPLDLIDVEPMLEAGRTVLYYLGPHGLDAEGLAEAAFAACGLDLVFEPVGLDAVEEEPIPQAAESGCGSCGSGGGCGSAGGGCGTDSRATDHSGGCSGCALTTAMKSGRRPGVTATRR